VTDHRIGLTLHRLDTVIDGDLDEIIEALKQAEHERKMSWPARPDRSDRR